MRIQYTLLNRITVVCLAGALSACSRRSTPVDVPVVEDGYTVIGGSISGILSRDLSPFRVVRDIVVDSLSALTIESGAKLFFQDSTKLIVQGELICIGTDSDPILFSSLSGRWKGIVISTQSLSTAFQFVIIERIDVSGDGTRNGAVEAFQSAITVSNCVLRDNAANHGGAVSMDESQSLISNCLFLNNSALGYGGALLSMRSSNRILNNTFVGNYSVNYGGGIVLVSPLLDEVQNNIFFGNGSGSGDARIACVEADSQRYVTRFNFLGSGGSSPLFVSESDLRLSAYSLCIDAGNPDVEFNDTDGTRNDQGAYGGPLGGWSSSITIPQPIEQR